MTDSSADHPPHAPSNVLVVEDDDGTRAFLKVALSLTFAVDVARTAAEALALARDQETTYDVFLLDISLRSGTGGGRSEGAARHRSVPHHARHCCHGLPFRCGPRAVHGGRL